MVTNATHIQRIVSDYYKQLYGEKKIRQLTRNGKILETLVYQD